MARTAAKNALLVVYCCCCAMTVMQLAAAAATADGHKVPAARVDKTGADGPVARSKRWSTTFGATSSNKNATANNGVRECNTDSDCLETPFTSCAVDPSDRKKRCFCADGKQPLNGDCSKRPRALRTSCETDLECLPNAICKNNATSTNSRLKICTCKDGFTEKEDSCNYADLLTFSYTTLFVTVFTSWIWNDRRA